jgi:hypothetical protein
LIGVDKYTDLNLYSLTDPSHDVALLREALVTYGGFVDDNITVLSTTAASGNHPTRTRILTVLSGLKSTIPDDAFLLFMFSGHGITKDEKSFLMPEDAVDTGDVTLLGQTSLSVEDVREAIAATQVKQALVILDSCRDDPSNSKGLSPNGLTKSFVDGFDFGLHNQSIAASAEIFASSIGGKAWVDANTNLGYLTEFLLEGVQGAAADQNGNVTLGQLATYIQKNVPLKVGKDHPGDVQLPFVKIDGYLAQDLVFAHVPIAVQFSVPAMEASTLNTTPGSSPKIFVDTSTVPIADHPNASPETTSAEADPHAPLTLQTPNINYAALFETNRTDEVALSNLGEAAFKGGNYDWTIKLLEQAKALKVSEVWMSKEPYLAAAYWLDEHNDKKFKAALQEIAHNMTATNPYLSQPAIMSMCLSELQTVRRLLPGPQAEELDSVVNEVRGKIISWSTTQPPERTLACTFHGESASGNSAWLRNDSCIIPNANKLDQSFRQSDFTCCGGGAQSPTTNAGVPVGLEIVVSGKYYWSVANPILQSDKFTLTTYCGPGGGPLGSGCDVDVKVYAHYSYTVPAAMPRI